MQAVMSLLASGDCRAFMIEVEVDFDLAKAHIRHPLAKGAPGHSTRVLGLGPVVTLPTTVNQAHCDQQAKKHHYFTSD